ncbi:MAG: sigma-70 family RNA polymerase sigma factor [Anaerolineae bacterium]|jgi:RNA polymerase sigma-70 factor (ECF subfamily)
MDQEQRWIEAARRGDRDAFGRLVQAYQRPVYNLTYRMLGNAEEAEDAAQEVFLRAYRKLDTFDPGRKFSTWLLSIASHYCIDRLRRRRLKWLSLEDERLPPSVLVSHQAGPERRVVQGEQQAQIQALLDTLSDDYRAAVILHYWYDFSYEEIAETTGSTVSAIKSRLFRARRMLAQQLQEAEAQAGALALAY